MFEMAENRAFSAITQNLVYSPAPYGAGVARLLPEI
jgi:hypothetical protein